MTRGFWTAALTAWGVISSNVMRQIFRSPRSTFDQPVANFSRAAVDIKKWSGVEDFHAHDLRRSFSTEITGLGFTRVVADRLLNHAEPGVGGTYDRYDYAKEKTEAMDAWTRRLRGILGLSENVVQLTKKKA